MLSSVSPVITGAAAASPHPTRPLSASIRTSTLSARRTSSPAMMTGLSMGRLTAIGSMVRMRTAAQPLQILHAGLLDNLLEHSDFLGYARPGRIGALRPYLETGFIKLLLHFRRGEDLERFLFQPLNRLRRRLGRRQQPGVGGKHEVLVARSE